MPYSGRMIKSVALLYQVSLLSVPIPRFPSTPTTTPSPLSPYSATRSVEERDTLGRALRVYVEGLPEDMKGVRVVDGRVVVNGRTATLVSWLIESLPPFYCITLFERFYPSLYQTVKSPLSLHRGCFSLHPCLSPLLYPPYPGPVLLAIWWTVPHPTLLIILNPLLVEICIFAERSGWPYIGN